MKHPESKRVEKLTAISTSDANSDPRKPKRIAERLIIESYRRWCAWATTGEEQHFEAARDNFEHKLGRENGTFALNLFYELASKLRENSTRPLRCRALKCEGLCFHEILLLGLLSGFQHDDETAVILSIDGLTGNLEISDEVYVRAEALATYLHANENQLFPIPATTIKTVLTEIVSTTTLQ